MNIQLCNGYELDEEILVNFTEKGKQVIILDLGALVQQEKKGRNDSRARSYYRRYYRLET